MRSPRASPSCARSRTSAAAPDERRRVWERSLPTEGPGDASRESSPGRAAGLYGCRGRYTIDPVDAWTFIWLMLILKIPLVALFLIVRWAVRATPETATDQDGGIGPRS